MYCSYFRRNFRGGRRGAGRPMYRGGSRYVRSRSNQQGRPVNGQDGEAQGAEKTQGESAAPVTVTNVTSNESQA